jgi:hypothetical protein
MFVNCIPFETNVILVNKVLSKVKKYHIFIKKRMKKMSRALWAASVAAVFWGASMSVAKAQDERKGNYTPPDEASSMRVVEPNAAVKAAIAKFESALRSKDINALGGMLFEEQEFAEYYKKQSGMPLDENTAAMFRQKRMEIKAKCNELASEYIKVSLGECREKDGDHGVKATFAQVKVTGPEQSGVLNLVFIPYNNEMKLVMFDH